LLPLIFPLLLRPILALAAFLAFAYVIMALYAPRWATQATQPQQDAVYEKQKTLRSALEAQCTIYEVATHASTWARLNPTKPEM
jgi:hypothetical protein